MPTMTVNVRRISSCQKRSLDYALVYVFARQRDRQTVVVGLNADTREAKLDLDVHVLLPDGVLVRAEWSGQQYTVTDGYVRGISIPARDGCVWVGEKPS
jgi:Neopullulanase-like, C-terminal domain